MTPNCMVQLTCWGKTCRPKGLWQAWEVVDEKLVRFNKAECMVLHMGQGNLKHRYWLGGEDSSPEEKDLRMMADEKLSMTWQCALTAHKANRALGCIQSSGDSRREGVLPLCSTLMRLHLENCIQPWGPQHRKGMDLLKQVQIGTMKLIRGLEHIFHEDKLRQLGLLTGEETATRSSYYPLCFQYLKGTCKKAERSFYKGM